MSQSSDNIGAAIGVFILLAIILFTITFQFILPPAFPTSFYVAPYDGEYTVRLHVSSGHDVEMVRPMPFEQATDLANHLNKDMAGKWGRDTYRRRGDE